MPKEATEFEYQACKGNPQKKRGFGFYLNGVWFDGFEIINGVKTLIEAKYWLPQGRIVRGLKCLKTHPSSEYVGGIAFRFHDDTKRQIDAAPDDTRIRIVLASEPTRDIV